MCDIAIKVENLNFNVGDRNILNNINIQIPKNSFTGILAPNGAGKTTLLKCFNGLNKANGTILINNNNINSFTPKELAKQVSFMNQNTNLDFAFTCKEIVTLGRYPYLIKGHWARVGDQDIVKKYMKLTDTWHLKDKVINKLSGGERQRVLFAKVLTQETDIILLDEPTSSMDIYNQRQLMSFGKELTKSNKTVVMAIHDLNTAIDFCDYFILMKSGEIVETGDFKKVFTQENLKNTYNLDTYIYQSPVSQNYQLEII